MIIKSKSRKIGNFDQLYDYMKKGAEQHHGFHVFSKNVYARDRDGILQEFFKNAELFRKRQNSVYLYHEIISITRSDTLTIEKQQAMLHSIVSQYVESRAKDNLVWGYMHNDAKTNIHFHLMISSNARGQTKNLRLSKKDFDTAKRHTEAWTNQFYPELQQGLIIGKQAGKKTSHNGTELQKRTGKMPERERVMSVLQDIFANTHDKTSFFNRLQTEHLEIYTRGKNIGFVDTLTGRKYRLNTLGLGDAFQVMSQKIELQGNSKNKHKPNPPPESEQGNTENHETTKADRAKEALAQYRKQKDNFEKSKKE